MYLLIKKEFMLAEIFVKEIQAVKTFMLELFMIYANVLNWLKIQKCWHVGGQFKVHISKIQYREIKYSFILC